MNNVIQPAVSKTVIIRRVGETKTHSIFFILDPAIPSWLFINEDGLDILNLCNGTHTITQIAQIIADTKHLQPEATLPIVRSFLDDLKNSQLLSPQPAETAATNPFQGIALEITKQCNLRCLHCYLAAGPASDRELTFPEIQRVLHAIQNLGGVSVAVGGGEPLLRGDCLDILESAASLELLMSLGTNGTLIDKPLAKRLSELPVKIQVSLDGATPQTHDRIRGEGSYELAVRGIDHLLNEGMEKEVLIAFTPMKLNIHEVPDIIEFAIERHIPVVQFPPLSPSGRARDHWSELKLSDDETLWFWEYVSKKADALKGKMDLLADCFSININNPGVPYRCSIGTQLRVDPNGDVYPCQCFHFGREYCLGNVRETSLEHIVHSQRLQQAMDECFHRPSRIRDCQACDWRNFCGSGCMGNAYERNGTILSPESCAVRKKFVETLFEGKLKDILSREISSSQGEPR